MILTWTEGNGWHAVAPDAKTAATAIRTELIARALIGKWSTVTVELLKVGPGVNVYREVV